MKKSIFILLALAASLSVSMAQSTGTIIDTTFASSNSPAYADGDLSTQNQWEPISGSKSNAFNVMSAGDGFAETKSFSNAFDNALDRQVYYNQPTFNDEGNAWNGTVVFRLEATPNEGLYATNIAGTVTNIQPVAILDKGQIFDFGLTADTNAALHARDNEANILINARMSASGNMIIQLNGYNTVENIILTLDREDLGWDPEWQDGTASNTPIFDTEWITLDWTISKTPTLDTYSAVVNATIDGVTTNGIKQYTDDSNPVNQPTDAYVSNSVYFAMGHNHEANGVAAGPPATNGIVHVNIDALSLTHTNSSIVETNAPVNLTGTAGDLTITVAWEGAFEANSFDVYRSETDGGPYDDFLGNTTERSYLDTDVVDQQLYYYVVKAKYDGVGDSDYSDQLGIKAVEYTKVLEWNSVGVVDNNYNLSQEIASTSNGVLTILGALTNAPTDSGNYPLLYPGEGPGNYSGTPVYGVVQKDGSAINRLRMRSQYFDYNVNLSGQSGNAAALLYLKAGTNLNLTTSAYQYELTMNNGGPEYSVAVRDSISGNWYVTDETYISGFSIEHIGDSNILWRTLDVAELNATSVMSRTNNPIVTPSLTSLDAIGLFAASGGANIRPFTLVVKTVATTEPYDAWAASFGLSGDDASKTNDYDADGLNNVWEWGLGGDPTNSADFGITERGVEVDGNGDFIYVYPRLTSSDRPDYFLTETTNLVGTAFTEEDDYEVATGPWPGEPDFEAVTNAIPTTNTVQFIKLNIE